MEVPRAMPVGLHRETMLSSNDFPVASSGQSLRFVGFVIQKSFGSVKRNLHPASLSVGALLKASEKEGSMWRTTQISWHPIGQERL